MGVQINWTNPLARALVHCIPLTEGRGLQATDVANGNRAVWTGVSDPVWNTTRIGWGPRNVLQPNGGYYSFSRLAISGPAQTYEVWIQPGNTVTNNGFFGADDGTLVPSSWAPGLFTDGTGVLTFYIWDGAANQQVSGPVLSANTLYHVVATSDGVNLSLYVDGALYAQQASGPADFTGLTNLSVHRAISLDTSDYRNEGVLLSMRVWNRALGAQAVRSLYTDPWGMFGAAARSNIAVGSANAVTISASATGTAAISKLRTLRVAITSSATGTATISPAGSQRLVTISATATGTASPPTGRAESDSSVGTTSFVNTWTANSGGSEQVLWLAFGTQPFFAASVALAGHRPVITAAGGTTIGTAALAGQKPVVNVQVTVPAQPITATAALAGHKPTLVETSLYHDSDITGVGGETEAGPPDYSGVVALLGNRPVIAAVGAGRLSGVQIAGRKPVVTAVGVLKFTGVAAVAGHKPVVAVAVGALVVTGSAHVFARKPVLTVTTVERFNAAVAVVAHKPVVASTAKTGTMAAAIASRKPVVTAAGTIALTVFTATAHVAGRKPVVYGFSMNIPPAFLLPRAQSGIATR